MEPIVTFIRIPKNASTSIYEALHTTNTIREDKLKNLFYEKSSRYKGVFSATHCLLSEAVEELGGSILHLPSFAVVRNPYDRLVSMFFFAKKNNLISLYMERNTSFLDFCRFFSEEKENNIDFFHGFTQLSYLMLDNKIGVDRILRFENLDNDFKNFILEHGLSNIPVDLPRKNSTRHDSYDRYYCGESKKIVKKIWKEDLNEFKYSF